MTVLPKELQERIKSLFGLRDIITDFDFAKTSFNQVSDPIRKTEEIFLRYKSHIFEKQYENFINATEIPLNDPMSTSLDFLFGGPLYRGEVMSIEGSSNVGKTRLCVKLAHEVAQSGKVLFIDCDFALQPRIFDNIVSSLNLSKIITYQFNENSLPDNSKPCSLHIALCSNNNNLFDIINLYLKNARPDLIIIDSAISLFQSSIMKNGPGSGLIQEFANEFKNIVHKANCVGIITNSLRTDSSGPAKPFLGHIYSSLWHSRLIMSTKTFYLCKCELISSPRFPYHLTNVIIETLREASTDDNLDNDSDIQ